MPPKAKYTKESVLQSAIEIVRKEGAKGLTARRLGKSLGGSACPIFTLFEGMEGLWREVLHAAGERYAQYIREEEERGEYPAYKASGMAYVRFAKEERELFKLLFMRDRSGEKIEDNRAQIRPILQLLESSLNLGEEQAYLFHLETWIYVHGIATMIASSYLEWDMQFISDTLSDIYAGLKARFKEKECQQLK